MTESTAVCQEKKIENLHDTVKNVCSEVINVDSK